jgi:hypothetical protein
MTRVLVTDAVSELFVVPARVRVAAYTNLSPMLGQLDGSVSDAMSQMRTFDNN